MKHRVSNHLQKVIQKIAQLPDEAFKVRSEMFVIQPNCVPVFQRVIDS